MIGREGRNENQTGNGKESSSLKMAFSAGPKAAEDYLEMARNQGFDWIDISGSSPGNFPEKTR
jgi:hypothetical protein